MTTETTATGIAAEAIHTASLYPLATLEARTAGTARVLVTRYWPRGVKSDAVDYWMRDLAPSAALLKSYHTGQVDWARFAEAYRAEMLGHCLPSYFRALCDLLDQHGALTLLCVEHCPRDGQDERDVRCHRRLLRALLVGETQEGEA